MSHATIRIRLACSLLAVGCPPTTIQALARWRSAESLEVYARLSPSDYAAWVSKALSQRIDFFTTRRLPRPTPIDDSVIVASFYAASSLFDKAERTPSDAQPSALFALLAQPPTSATAGLSELEPPDRHRLPPQHTSLSSSPPNRDSVASRQPQSRARERRAAGLGSASARLSLSK